MAVWANTRTTAYASGTGTTALVFAYTVVAADMDDDGISVAADALTLDSDDKIEDSDDQAADQTLPVLASQSGHRVNGGLTPPARIAPAFESIPVEGATLVVTTSENLAAVAHLANAAFTVKKPQGAATRPR